MASLVIKVLGYTVMIIMSSYFASSAKVLVLTTLGGSQYVRMRNVAEELASRKHEVVLLVPSMQAIKKSDKFEQRLYQVPFPKGFAAGLAGSAMQNGLKVLLTKGLQTMLQVCESIINNTKLIQDLKIFKLLVADALFCGPILSDLLNIPRVELCPVPARVTAITRNIPVPPSYVPVFKSGNTDQMTFFQRVKNVFMYGVQMVFLELIFVRNFNNLKMKYNIKPERDFRQAMADYEMILISTDFAIQYPHPLLPSTVMVGPLSVQKPKPLPADLEKFVASSGEHGVIMVSFGTFISSNLEKQQVDMLAEAFGKLKQSVVWRLKGYIPSQLGANIKVVDWLPQNDLLAHPHTKLFVTHAGHNSQTEAAYWGKPVVMFPLFGDQFDNAFKGEQFGLGLKVDHNTVTADELYKTIERVLYEPRFKETANRISQIMRDRKRFPLEEAVDWIEFVLRHRGARHLRAQVVSLTWYQYYLLDVLLFLIVIFGAFSSVTVAFVDVFASVVPKETVRNPKTNKTADGNKGFL